MKEHQFLQYIAFLIYSINSLIMILKKASSNRNGGSGNKNGEQIIIPSFIIVATICFDESYHSFLSYHS